jgi:hypothetical protein
MYSDRRIPDHRIANQQAEAPDALNGQYHHCFASAVDFDQRQGCRILDFVGENRTRSIPNSLNRDHCDGIGVHIEAGPRIWKIRGSQLGTRHGCNGDGLDPDGAPGNRWLPQPARGSGGRNIDGDAGAMGVGLQAKIEYIIYPLTMRRK